MNDEKFKMAECGGEKFKKSLANNALVAHVSHFKDDYSTLIPISPLSRAILLIPRYSTSVGY